MFEIPNNCPYLPFLWVFESFTNLPNLTTHLMISSFKKAKEKI